ncbi:hypothetical protein HPB48_023039 [Haemaphysalis longicornis]|uniref:Uncharacterized protein n=1 Tax=Haemaphysalis longicornis TaxID=44386 RepID=A0A9J6GUV9_HAELO|nr:hypothetical protein HPB48_023039 [Haemaphysalis longicornis]
MSTFSLVVPRDYGYVVLVGVGSIPVNMWLVSRVYRARKKFDIKVQHRPLRQGHWLVLVT